MERLIIPSVNDIRNTVKTPNEELDFSYSEYLKSVAAAEMEISKDKLKELKCALYTDFSPDLRRPMAVGEYIDESKIIKILVTSDFNSDFILSVLIHEVAHSLSLYETYSFIVEGVANYYEKKWFLKYDKLEDFYNKHTKNYLYSAAFMDLVKSAVYHDNTELFESNLARGKERDFIKNLDLYFKSLNINTNALLFYIDVMFNYFYSNAALAKYPNSTFNVLYEKLWNYVIPTLFNPNVSSDEIKKSLKIIQNGLNLYRRSLDFDKELGQDFGYLKDYINVLGASLYSMNMFECAFDSENYSDKIDDSRIEFCIDKTQNNRQKLMLNISKKENI